MTMGATLHILVRPRAAAALAAVFAAAPAFALEAPLTAEQAVEVEQAGVRDAVGTAPCPRDRDTGDIIVCGRRGADPNRLPLPAERLPGEREHLLPGEIPRAQASFNTCVIGCQPSGIMVNPFQVIMVGSKIVRHVLHKDE
jgi:hypothetical protein